MDLVIGSYPRHSERWGKFVLNNRLKPCDANSHTIYYTIRMENTIFAMEKLVDGNIIIICICCT